MEGLEGGKGEVEGEERDGVELVEEEGREMEEINDEELMPSVTFLIDTAVIYSCSFCSEVSCLKCSSTLYDLLLLLYIR